MMSRSAYLSSLRRAFLLRVHPDRFRSDDIRVQQAALVKALANRMSQADFTAWLQQRNEPLLKDSRFDDQTYPFVMEKRDGSFLSLSIALDKSVDDVLLSMSTALLESGAASLPTPPLTSTIPIIESNTSTFRTNPLAASAPESTSGSFDSRYNVRSNQGRQLRSLLRDGKLNERIRELKAARVDAQATALQVRRLYQFAAIDATETKWSSASVAVLLRRLLSLHDEFASSHLMKSFYPLRLVFSPRELAGDQRVAALDVYGGVLYLNPASTAIQWLETLQVVTADRIDEIQTHRATLLERTKSLRGTLGVKIKQGFTCSSRDYHWFLERLTSHRRDNTSLPIGTVSIRPTDDFSAPMLEPVLAVVEAEASCRRASVTRCGTIQLGAGMSESECRDSFHRLSTAARKKARADMEATLRCQEVITALQWNLGLQKVYRTGFVSHQEFMACLLRFVALVHAENDGHLFNSLTGNSLGIAASGQLCHVADDGSVVIPHNWT